MRSQDSESNQFWYDTEQIKEYAAALQDVDGVQSALLLSTQGLSAAQIQQTLASKGLTNQEIYDSMVAAGLLANKTELNVAEAQAAINKTLETLASEGNTAALTAEQFAAIGLVAAEGEEATATAVVTSKKLEQALADEVLTKEQVQLIATTLGLATAQKAQVTSIFPQLISSFKKMALVTWEQVKATAALLVTSRVGWLTIAFGALSLYAVHMNKNIKTTEDLKKSISSLKDEYSDLENNISDYDSKIEENNKRITELQGLDRPTYTDTQEITRLQNENAALERNKGIAQDRQAEIDQEGIKKLEEKYYKEYETNQAAYEKKIKKKNVFNYAKNVVGYDLYQFHKYSVKDTKTEKLDKDLATYDELSDLYNKLTESGEVEIDFNNSTLSEDTISVLTKFADYENIANLSTEDLDKLSKEIENYKTKLNNWNTDYSSQIAEAMDFDQYLESDYSKMLLSIQEDIYKRTNPDEWKTDIIKGMSYDANFTNIIDDLISKINTDSDFTYENILSDETYSKILKALSMQLYGMSDEETLKKAASELFSHLLTGIDDGTYKVPISFEEAFNSSDFSETKEKLLELAKSGKMTSDVLSSTEDYKKLLDKTGLSAERVKNEILDTLSAQEKLSAASNAINSLTSAYEEIENSNIGFVKADTLESLPEIFKKLDGFNSFSQIVGDPTSSKEKIQQAFNDIISEYLVSQRTLSSLVNASESEVNSYIANLKQMGITNAEEVVNQTRESMQQNLVLINEAENEYTNYLQSKDGYDNEYINSIASKNNQLSTALGEPYKADYDNWCKLLSKKVDAYNKFAESIQNAQHHPLSPNNIADEKHAREIIAESKGKLPKEASNNFVVSGQAYSKSGGAKEISKYTLAEIQNAHKLIESIEEYNQANEQLNLNFEKITLDLSSLNFSPTDPDSSGTDSSKSSATSLFDFLELRLTRLKSKTQNIINQITDYTATALKRTLLNNSISSIFDEIDAQVQAYSRYMAKAESIALDETLKEKVRDGSLEVDYTLTEEQSEALSEYQNWYEKALAAQEEINSLKTEELNKVKELAELEATIYQHRINILDYNKEYNNQYISIQEAMGRELYASDYQDVIDNNLDTQDYLVKQIKIYKELAEKLDTTSDAYHEIQEKIQELTLSYRDLEKENIELTNTINKLPVQKIQSWLDYLDTIGKEYKSLFSYRQQLGAALSKSHYQDQINNNLQQIKSLEEQSKLVHSLYITAQNARNLTAQREYSKQYHEIQSSIYDLKAANDELKDSMRDDIYWRDFEKAHTAAQKLADNLQSLNSMIDDDSLLDDNGKLTKNGNAKVALYLKQYETAKEEVVNYMKDLNNAFKLHYQGMYTTDEYQEKLAELQKGLLEASNNVKSFADSLTDLYLKQGQTEIDALTELIKARTEALNKKKEYYDYDKTIRTKSKDIQALETQKAALEATEDTLEKRKKLLELEEQLQEKRDDLEDTKYDHEINLIVNGLDDFTADIQERFDTYSKNLQNSLEMQTDIINNANKMYADSYGKVQQVLDGILSSYGIDTSQTLFNTSTLLGSSTTAQLMESFFKINSPDYTIANPQTTGNVINCDVTFDFKTDKTSAQDFEQMIPELTDKVSSQLAKNLKKIGY